MYHSISGKLQVGNVDQSIYSYIMITVSFVSFLQRMLTYSVAIHHTKFDLFRNGICWLH